MLLNIINYTVRGLILVLGILLVSGAIFPEGSDPTLLRVMGVVFILFGTYRLILYYTQQKRLRREFEDDTNT